MHCIYQSVTRVACTQTLKQIDSLTSYRCLHFNVLKFVIPLTKETCQIDRRKLGAPVNHLGRLLPSRNYAEQAKYMEGARMQPKSEIKPISAKKGPTPTKKTRFWEQSGDLIEKEEIDKSEIFYPYRGLEKELDQAPEHIRKLATLEFCDSKQRMAHAMWKLRQKILEVCSYSDERELTIARMTLQIRNLKEHRANIPTDVRGRTVLHDLISKRRKKLRHLRKRDYESFMWLLYTLQIKYVPAFTPPKESRRAKMRRLVQEEAEAKIQEKFDEIEVRMMEEKEAFEEEKKLVWQQIEKDIETYGLDKDLIEYKVEKVRRDNIEERKGYVVPPPNTYQYIRYLKRMSSRERTDKYLYYEMLRKKKMRQMAEEMKDTATN